MKDGRGQELDLLLGHGLTDAGVGLALGEAAHLDGDEHDLLLVDHGAVGLAEDVIEARVIGDRGLLAVHAVDVGRDHAGAKGARTVQGDKCHHVLVLGGLHVLDGGRHARGLDLEDAGRVARSHELEDLRVVEGDLRLVDVDAVVGLDVRLGLRDDRKRAQAQEVHLEQAHVRDGVALVLGDLDATLGVELRGTVLVDGVTADEDRARVHALAADQALERQRRVDDAVGVRIGVVGVDEVLRVLVLAALDLVHRCLERGVGRGANHLGEALAHVDREVENARGVVDGLLGLDG